MEEFGPSQALERLAGSIQRATESIGGSCERARPFASMFLVATADNSLVWRCSQPAASRSPLPVTFLGPIATPLRAMLFAAGGVGLAWLWYNAAPWVPLVIVAMAWAITVALQSYAGTRITSKPSTALTLYEFRLLGVAAVSAGAPPWSSS